MCFYFLFQNCHLWHWKFATTSPINMSSNKAIFLGKYLKHTGLCLNNVSLDIARYLEWFLDLTGQPRETWKFYHRLWCSNYKLTKMFLTIQLTIFRSSINAIFVYIGPHIIPISPFIFIFILLYIHMSGHFRFTHMLQLWNFQLLQILYFICQNGWSQTCFLSIQKCLVRVVKGKCCNCEIRATCLEDECMVNLLQPSKVNKLLINISPEADLLNNGIQNIKNHSHIQL